MAKLISIFRFSCGFVLVAGASVLTFLIAIPLIPWRVARIRLCNFYGHTVGRAIMFLAGAHPDVDHKERLKAAMPAIFVANHTSTLDAFVSIWLCPYGGCGVFKKEIARIPFFGQLLILSGHLMLDRSRHQAAVEGLQDTALLMERSHLGVWIMPEGTRSRDGRLGKFKTGFVHLAIATGFPVVPVVFHNAQTIWPLGPLDFHPGPLKIEILPPVITSAWKEETSAMHADQIRALLAKALGDERPPEPAPP